MYAIATMDGQVVHVTTNLERARNHPSRRGKHERPSGWGPTVIREVAKSTKVGHRININKGE